MGYLDVVEQQETIIHRAKVVISSSASQIVRTDLLVTKLGTNITHIYIIQWLMGFEVTDLHNERVWTVVLAINKQLGHNHSVIGRATEGSDPPLRSSQCWGVDGECLIAGVPGGGGFQTAHVRSVTQFCLRIATDDLVFFCTFKEQFVLLGGALFPESHLDSDRNGQLDSLAEDAVYLPGTCWRVNHTE